MSTVLSTLPQDMARQVRAARDAAHLSQTEFAKVIGVSLRTVQNWESGASFPQPSHRRKLAAFLETNGGVAA